VLKDIYDPHILYSKDYNKMSLADFVSIMVKEIVDILRKFDYFLMKTSTFIPKFSH
jgi:hypothetical protein